MKVDNKLIEAARKDIDDPNRCPSPGLFAYGKQLVPKVAEYNIPYFWIGSIINSAIWSTVALIAGWELWALLAFVIPTCFFVTWAFCTQAFAEMMGPMAGVDYIREFYRYFKQIKSGVHYVLRLKGGTTDISYNQGAEEYQDV